MMCAKPFRIGVAEHGCGQCMPCRLNRRRLWTSRLMLEAATHETSYFCTLTYDNDEVPSDGSVSVREAQLFIKRLRESVAPVRIRYYLVGEYGDHTGRPHYHVALFGLQDVQMVRSAWTKGFVHIGQLTAESASYIVSYVVKRWNKGAVELLKGKAPEFSIMSRRPGIGYEAAKRIAEACVDRDGVQRVEASGDVVRRFRSGNRMWPLGRYLVSKIRRDMGVSEERARLIYEETLKGIAAEGWDGRADRDRRREHSDNHARRLHSISSSRKGVGL